MIINMHICAIEAQYQPTFCCESTGQIANGMARPRRDWYAAKPVSVMTDYRHGYERLVLRRTDVREGTSLYVYINVTKYLDYGIYFMFTLFTCCVKIRDGLKSVFGFLFCFITCLYKCRWPCLRCINSISLFPLRELPL